MVFLQLREENIRIKLVLKKEFFLRVLRSIVCNNFLSIKFRIIAQFYLYKFYNKWSRVGIVFRCFFTKYPRKVLRKWFVSSSVLKKNLRLGYISGFRKGKKN